MLWKDRLYQSYVSSGQGASAEGASSADTFFRPRAPYLRYVINVFIRRDRQLKIVDLGCGSGACLYFLKRAGYENVIGVDVSAEQIAQAHRLGIPEAREGQIYSFLSNTPSESVDVTLLFDLLEHLTRDELFNLLDGVYRVLRAGGCIVHVSNAEASTEWIRYGDLTHEQSFTAQSLKQVLAR